MEKDWILIIAYSLFGLLSIYCYLFQRTVLKIRKFAFGTENKQFEKYLYPKWYLVINTISQVRYVALIWLFSFNWEYAIISYIVIGLFKLIIPVNDYSHIQLIKKMYLNRIDKGIASEMELDIYEVILEVEKKTL